MEQRLDTKIKANQIIRWAKSTKVFPFLEKGRGRCDMLELLQSIDLDDLNQYSLVELVSACDLAINTYTVCSGYAKHWKHYKREMIERIKHDTSMYVYNMRVTSYDLPSVLLKAGCISKQTYYKLKEILETGNLRHFISTVYGGVRVMNTRVTIPKKVTPFISNQNEWRLDLGNRQLPKCIIEKYNLSK